MDRRTRGNALCLVGLCLAVGSRTVLPVGERFVFGIGLLYGLFGVAVIAVGAGYRLTTARAVAVAVLGLLVPVTLRAASLAAARPDPNAFGAVFSSILFGDIVALTWWVVSLSFVYAMQPSSGVRAGIVTVAPLPFVYDLATTGDTGFGYGFTVPLYTVIFFLAVLASVPVYLALNGWRRPDGWAGTRHGEQTPG